MVVRVVYNNNDLCLDLNFLVGSGSYDATMSSIGSFRFSIFSYSYSRRDLKSFARGRVSVQSHRGGMPTGSGTLTP